MLVISQVFSSSGIGLLVGFLMGMSASPLVGMVVGAITGLLASFLGLAGRSGNPLPGGQEPGEHEQDGERREEREENAQLQRKLVLTGIRTGTFALACVIGVLMGMHIRTHNLMSPSLLDKQTELVDLGFTSQEARWIVADQKFTATTPSVEDSVLFSNASSEDCDRADPDRFASFAALSQSYADMDLQPFARIALELSASSRDEAAALQAMLGIVTALCEDD
ncbi:MAG: hypothetical protein AB8B57_09095 [Congregibacter sp.]